MIAAVLAVLITQTREGNMSVVEGLSDHACEVARCIAINGRTCEEQDQIDAAIERAQAKEDEAWAKAHPKEVAACEARARAEQAKAPHGVTFGRSSCDYSPQHSFSWSYVYPTDIKTARCAK